MTDLWHTLPAAAQDLALLVLLILPGALTAAAVLHRYHPWPLVRALIWRFRTVCAIFALLIAVSVAMGIGLTAQERGLRRATAQAADKFDLIVAAPGSEMAVLMATVFLQPTDLPLLDGVAYAAIADDNRVDLAAPIAVGDSFGGAPIIGTTADLIHHLSDGRITGQIWRSADQAVIGADVPLRIGSEVHPAHGTGDGADTEAHSGHGGALIVSGRMAPTGTPWDRAIFVPIETVWGVHGLANGHAPQASDQLGPPFDAAYFPGTPAVIVRTRDLWANYTLQSALTNADQMAFFPGEVLARLHAVIGDVRQVISILVLATQALVVASVLSALLILTRLFQRQLALLRAISAPNRFVMAVVWSFAAALSTTGAALGCVLGYGAAGLLSALVGARTGMTVTAFPGWSEMHLVAGFVSVTSLLALGPALAVLRQPVAAALRG